MWTLLNMFLVFTDAAPAFRVGGLVFCASYPSDTVYPKTHNASAPKTHASRLPKESASYQLTLQAHCVITHSLKCPHPSPVYAYALWAVRGYYWDVWNEHPSPSPTVYSRHNFRWMCLWSRGRRMARTSETFSVPVGRSYPRRRSAPCAGGDAGRCRSSPDV